jgi:hypothetical protein
MLAFRVAIYYMGRGSKLTNNVIIILTIPSYRNFSHMHRIKKTQWRAKQKQYSLPCMGVDINRKASVGTYSGCDYPHPYFILQLFLSMANNNR